MVSLNEIIRRGGGEKTRSKVLITEINSCCCVTVTRNVQWWKTKVLIFLLIFSAVILQPLLTNHETTFVKWVVQITRQVHVCANKLSPFVIDAELATFRRLVFHFFQVWSELFSLLYSFHREIKLWKETWLVKAESLNERCRDRNLFQ